MEKKEAARLLFMEGYSLTDICKLLQISDTTMTRWCADGDWKTKRTMRGLFEQTSMEAMKELADYQLSALTHKVKALREAGEWELLDKGHFDALSKAFSNIKGPEFKWEHAVRVMRRFVEFLQDKDIELAKQVTEFSDIYLNELRKSMNQ
jgi:Protein of unknown function (DUF1804)